MSNGSKNKIKVAFLFQASENWLGGLNYYKNLFFAISRIKKPIIEPYILKPKSDNAKILLDIDNVKILKKNLKYRFLKIFSKIFKNKFNPLIIANQIDVISHVYSKDCNVPTISWIPDFQHLHLPEMFTENETKERDNEYLEIAQNSKLVILSSNDALNDFKNFAPEYADKGRVLHFVAIPDADAYKNIGNLEEQIKSKFKLPEKYFYVPNQFWKHKNHITVLKAVSMLKKQNLNINVVFTGNTKDYRNPDFFNKEILSFIKEEKLEENIKILGIVELDEVYYLMRNCISIINPSLFEGWSSTVEEAKSIGKNIILSNLNVHIEQNPPCAKYFNPLDYKELANILKEKWLNENTEIDYKLEQDAQNNLFDRIENFGKQYQKIVEEALNL